MESGTYSYSLTTFSPSGKLVQIEHAMQAVKAGETSLGIKATNGVVIATARKTPSVLVDDSMIQKVAVVCPNIGIVYSGMGPDFRIILAKARKSALTYWKAYGEYPPVKVLVADIAAVFQNATQSGGVRPFGISVLVAGFDIARGPSLYRIDPSGTYYAWKACSIGKNESNASVFLEKRFHGEISLEDAIHTAVLTLKEGYEGVLKAENLEIGIVSAADFSAQGRTTFGNGADDSPLFAKLSDDEIEQYLSL